MINKYKYYTITTKLKQLTCTVHDLVIIQCLTQIMSYIHCIYHNVTSVNK